MVIFFILLIAMPPLIFIQLLLMIGQYFGHRYNNNDNFVKMKYKEFLNIYRLDKEKWEYGSFWKEFKYKATKPNRPDWDYEILFVKFNFVDYWFAKSFMKKEVKEKNKKRIRKSEQKATELFVNSVQKDIDKIRGEGQVIIQKARHITDEIKENLING